MGNACFFKNRPFGLITEPKIEGKGGELGVEHEASEALLAGPALDRLHQGPSHAAASIAGLHSDAFGFDGVAKAPGSGGSDRTVCRERQPMGGSGIVTVFLKLRGYTLLLDKDAGSDLETGGEFGLARDDDANGCRLCVSIHLDQRRAERAVRRGVASPDPAGSG